MKLRSKGEIAKFIKESADELLSTERDVGCCYFFINPYDHTYSLSVGWMGGYDEYQGKDYASRIDPRWRINAAIVKYNPYDFAELEFIDMPYDCETGEVFNTMITLSHDDDWERLAGWYLDMYREIVRIEAEKEEQ